MTTQMTIPDEAVQAAQATYMTFGIDDEMMREALTAAAPFLQGVKVKSLEWREGKLQDGRKKWLSSAEVITETHPSWEHQGFHLFHAAKTFDTVDEAKAAAQADYEARIRSAIEVAALEPSLHAQALKVGDLRELLERLDAGLEYEGDLETENDHIELFNVEAAQELFSNAAAAIRALSSQSVADDCADKPSVKGIVATHFGDSFQFSGVNGNGLILVSVRGDHGLVPIKYLLPHQLYVRDVQTLNEEGEVLVCEVPLYAQQINVSAALPASPGASE